MKENSQREMEIKQRAHDTLGKNLLALQNEFQSVIDEVKDLEAEVSFNIFMHINLQLFKLAEKTKNLQKAKSNIAKKESEAKSKMEKIAAEKQILMTRKAEIATKIDVSLIFNTW